MIGNKRTIPTSISKASSYEEIGEFWDTHSLDDHWDETKSVEFEVTARPRKRIAVEPQIYQALEAEAHLRGLVPEALANLWLAEKLHPSK